MKMNQDHIKIIHDAFVSFSEDKHKMSLLSSDIHCGVYSDTTLSWSIFRSCKIEGNSFTWVCDNLYPYLNDTHITTVLKKEFNLLKKGM